VRELREALARGDSQALERVAHAIKGSVGNFAATHAFDLARRLEQMGREGDLVHAAGACAELEEAIEDLRPALAALREGAGEC
jgi:HPt (histidine-containing phosphotransfer) domain-containing protein